MDVKLQRQREQVKRYTAAWSRKSMLRARRKRLDSLRGADERDHDEDAGREQHGLQDVRAGVVEAEQDRERPAAGERRAEHFGPDQNRRAEDGNDTPPYDLARCGGR